jgi:hypothetical protein
MQPPAEMVHWMFATGLLILALCLVARAVVGEEVWNARRWRAYLWPTLIFLIGTLMWPVMTFYTTSTIHMVAHGTWAQAIMAAGAAELALVRGKATSPRWRLVLAFAFLVSGAAFLVHEQNGWFFQRSSFLHHAMGWTLVGASLVPFAQVLRPRSRALGVCFAATFVVLSVLLYADRDLAPVFGHLSELAGTPHR